ncbi:MAG: hypothetical protein Q9159_003649 [Coniocarpon cinnabarinum]
MSLVIESTIAAQHNIVYIPKVCDFFVREAGYPVTEFIDGTAGQVSNKQFNIVKLVVHHLHSIKPEEVGLVGPLGGGEPKGVRWKRTHGFSFASEEAVDGYFKAWTLPAAWKPSKHRLRSQSRPDPDTDLVLVHLDLAPRNFIWMKYGSLCLLGRESAGVYPRFFEQKDLALTGFTDLHFKHVITYFLELSHDDQEESKIVGATCDTSLRCKKYDLPSLNLEEVTEVKVKPLP